MDLAGLPYAIDAMHKDDIPTVTRIEQEVFSLPWSSTAFRYELEHNSASHYLVLRYTGAAAPGDADEARRSAGEGPAWLSAVRRTLRRSTEDASLLGYGGCWLMVDEAHISTLALRPQWRGRGLGEVLLAALIEVAYEHRASEVTLEVRVTNAVAQGLYRKYGFRQVGRRKAYYSDNREDAYIMTTDDINTPAYRGRFDDLRAELRRRLLAQRPDRSPR